MLESFLIDYKMGAWYAENDVWPEEYINISFPRIDYKGEHRIDFIIIRISKLVKCYKIYYVSSIDFVDPSSGKISFLEEQDEFGGLTRKQSEYGIRIEKLLNVNGYSSLDHFDLCTWDPEIQYLAGNREQPVTLYEWLFGDPLNLLEDMS